MYIIMTASGVSPYNQYGGGLAMPHASNAPALASPCRNPLPHAVVAHPPGHPVASTLHRTA